MNLRLLGALGVFVASVACSSSDSNGTPEGGSSGGPPASAPDGGSSSDAGSTSDAPATPGDSGKPCAPKTCADLGFDCGAADDGCGHALACGTCKAPATCGGTGKPNVCGGTGTLRYFGYYRDSDIQNYICEIQDHVSFAMTTTGDPAFSSDAKRAQEASYGIVDWGVTGAGALGGYLVQDDSDAAHWTADMWSTNKASLEGQVASLKSSYPGVHLMINLDGTFMQIPGFALPAGYDWFGIECYGRLGNAAADCKTRFDALKPLLPANGRVWILPPGETDYGDEASLVKTAQDIFAWAPTEPAIVGLMAFLWQSNAVAPATAVRDLPNLKSAFRQIGSAISGRNKPPITTCP
jgi:hypothetical protein